MFPFIVKSVKVPNLRVERLVPWTWALAKMKDGAHSSSFRIRYWIKIGSE